MREDLFLLLDWCALKESIKNEFLEGIWTQFKINNGMHVCIDEKCRKEWLNMHEGK